MMDIRKTELSYLKPWLETEKFLYVEREIESCKFWEMRRYHGEPNFKQTEEMAELRLRTFLRCMAA